MNKCILLQESKIVAHLYYEHGFIYQMEVMEVALDTSGSTTERRLAIIDKNRDLYLTQVRVYGSDRKTVKLGNITAEK